MVSNARFVDAIATVLRCDRRLERGRTESACQIQQGIISHLFDALCFPEWDPRTNRVTYRLYRRRIPEHITPIEHIPDVTDSCHVSGPRFGGELR